MLLQGVDGFPRDHISLDFFEVLHLFLRQETVDVVDKLLHLFIPELKDFSNQTILEIR